MKYFKFSEADLGPAHELEVMISAVVEEDFIAGFEADSEDTRVELHACTRIKDAVGIAIRDARDRGTHGPASDSSACRKVQQSAF